MYLLLRRRPLILCIAFIVILSTGILLILQKHAQSDREPYFINWTRTDTISCHYVTEGDVLQPAEDTNPPPDSIFFHETSCRGGLNSREACAVESVARIHSERTVYVLFNSPISDLVLKRSCLSILTQFKNVKLARLHTADYAKGTALGDMLAQKENNQSRWRIELTSDMLRYITMFKYGGVYLDTDMLVVKPLDALGKNWVAREDDNQVNVAAMAVGKDQLGHNLVSGILEDLKLNYRPDLWIHNGPGAMNRMLLKFCNTTSVRQLSARICHGFEVYSPDLIYPIPWTKKDAYFLPGDLPQGMEEKAFSHHLWNRLTYNMKVVVGSPYEKLASKYCPTIRNLFGERFGT